MKRAVSSLEEQHGQVLSTGPSLWGVGNSLLYISYWVPAESYKCENMQGQSRVQVVGTGGERDFFSSGFVK